MLGTTALINHSGFSSTSEVGLNFPPHHSACTAQAVPVGSTNRYNCKALVPVGVTNRDSPCATAERCGGKFSPTSLVEEESEWFISAVVRTTSSSSQLQAFRPTLLLSCLWACWAICGPGFWPNSGFQVVSRPFLPSRCHFFSF